MKGVGGIATVFYVLQSVIVISIDILLIAMFVRAILSWIPGADENKLGDFLYAVTEPFITPVRAILDRIPLFQGFPLDMSFFFTFILLSILSTLLGGL